MIFGWLKNHTMNRLVHLPSPLLSHLSSIVSCCIICNIFAYFRHGDTNKRIDWQLVGDVRIIKCRSKATCAHAPALLRMRSAQSVVRVGNWRLLQRYIAMGPSAPNIVVEGVTKFWRGSSSLLGPWLWKITDAFYLSDPTQFQLCRMKLVVSREPIHKALI